MLQMEGHESFNSLIGHNNIRYFSYGRHALAEALKIIGVGSGDRVLLPEFICRDLLSSVNSMGALPVYYGVNKKLALDFEADKLPAAKAVITVNYFGFPQDLGPFRDYCKRTGAVLIEDNAHGLFSRDEKGRFLGTRGDIGIFSLRKTILTPNGAALVVNNRKMVCQIPLQMEFDNRPEPLPFNVKRMLKRLPFFIGRLPLGLLTSAVRFLRKLRIGSEIAPSPSEAERMLPEVPNPCRKLLFYLSNFDNDKEIKRRRLLYVNVDNILRQMKVLPVFDVFPQNVVPYGYPFYAAESRIKDMKKLLAKYGLECFRWPELPDAIKPHAPEHYKTVWFVNFL